MLNHAKLKGSISQKISYNKMDAKVKIYVLITKKVYKTPSMKMKQEFIFVLVFEIFF